VSVGGRWVVVVWLLIEKSGSSPFYSTHKRSDVEGQTGRTAIIQTPPPEREGKGVCVRVWRGYGVCDCVGVCVCV
jgi:hypothetical protein